MEFYIGDIKNRKKLDEILIQDGRTIIHNGKKFQISSQSNIFLDFVKSDNFSLNKGMGLTYLIEKIAKKGALTYSFGYDEEHGFYISLYKK